MSESRHPVPVPPSGGVARQVAWAFAGALLRVGRAVPDYLAGGRAARTGGSASRAVGTWSDEDTGEWPAPGSSGA